MGADEVQEHLEHGVQVCFRDGGAWLVDVGVGVAHLVHHLGVGAGLASHLEGMELDVGRIKHLLDTGAYRAAQEGQSLGGAAQSFHHLSDVDALAAGIFAQGEHAIDLV